jgi:hypothetical protein
MDDEADLRNASSSISCFPSVKYPQHDQAFLVEAVLKHISSTENLQHDLAIFFPARNRPTKFWMVR